jgi:hypothetical protein
VVVKIVRVGNTNFYIFFKGSLRTSIARRVVKHVRALYLVRYNIKIGLLELLLLTILPIFLSLYSI